MLLALADKTLCVEEPKTITWIYETSVYIDCYRIQRTKTNFVIALI